MLDEITARRTLYAAFERVRENAGCRGADGVTVQQFGESLEWELDSIQDRLLRRCYHPFPLLRFEIPKSGNRMRSLSVPTVRDRVLQTAVYLTTRDLFDAELEENSYAFRQGRSVKDAVRRIDELRQQGFHWVVDADIEAFFDNIDHERLLARACASGTICASKPHPLSPSPISLPPPPGEGGRTSADLAHPGFPDAGKIA